MEHSINKDTPLEKIFRLGVAQKKALLKLKLQTAEDLLRYFPVRYGAPSKVKSIDLLTGGETCTIFGKISKLETKKGFKSKIAFSEAKIDDGTGEIKAVWFNQPYIAKMFGDGALVRIEGKISTKKDGTLYLSNPKIEKTSKLIGGGESLFGKEGEGESLSPIYSETRGVTSNWIYHAVQRILAAKVADNLEDPIPLNILEKYHLPVLRTSLFWIHAPRKAPEALAARKRLAFEEIFMIQLDRQREKYMAEKEKSFLISKTPKEIASFVKTFPFPLTGAQQRSVDTILSDFKRGEPMSRLLEGDVGSGKTAVAATAVFATVTTVPPLREFGALQVAYMAPTEILAEQHFESFIELFKEFKIPVGLITGSGAKKFPSKTNPSTSSGQVRQTWTKISKPQLLKWVENGEIPILIGTHALIQKQVKFKNLGFIIIDEQHRFGVKQRMKLRRRSDRVPHLLSMTATPIPRSLALTIFGDLDLSLLDELPPGRKPVETKIILPDGREAMYEKVREELRAGRQAYVICPRIDLPDPSKELAVNAASVTEEVEVLRKIFKEYKIAPLTGKMSPKDKEDTMREFKNHKTDILVATSVVEVGVNVPNATVIIIENAERFGLAQLHQLRGRVLRSSHKPYCFVFAESKSKKTVERLKSFSTAQNGFELAEADLQQRGMGDLAGVKQWGVSDLAMEALKNIKMVEAARAEARLLIEKDFELRAYPLLQTKLKKSQESVHME